MPSKSFIIVLNGDLPGYEDVSEFGEAYWHDDEIHDSSLKVMIQSKRSVFTSEFLIPYLEIGNPGTRLEVIEELEDYLRDDLRKMQWEHRNNLTSEELTEIKTDLQDLIERLKNVDLPYTNQQVLHTYY